MANQEQLEILKQGVEVWNEWVKNNLIIDRLPKWVSLEKETNGYNPLFYEYNGVNLSKADLSGLDLNGAILISANFSEANLEKTNLRGANLSEANLESANLRGANLSDAKLEKTNFWRANLTNAVFIKAYLGEADLTETTSLSALFNFSDLAAAKFRKAILRNAFFESANLHSADFTGADLTAANFNQVVLRRANLKNANLYGADLTGTYLVKAELAGADFGNVSLYDTTFGFTDLSEVIRLKEVIHVGPSIIGYDTIVASKGKIPEIFLRGCGLSDIEIESSKLATPGLDPEQVTDITYKIHQLYIKL